MNGGFSTSPFSIGKVELIKKVDNMAKKISQEDVIRRFHEVHGNRYDYSKVKYTGYDNKVTIICRIHGEFKQDVGVHLKGWGCSKCGDITRARKRKKNLSTFVSQSTKVHNGKYDYNKVVYKRGHEKVIITCPIHGDFMQTPSNHLKGNGCPLCVGKGAITMQNFEQLARKIHGDKYNYERVEFSKVSDKVIIGCPVHGWFSQIVSSHIKGGHGCQKCSAKERAKRRTNDTSEFIQKAIAVHGDKYDYSKTEYVDTRTKVCIICKECGAEFFQFPLNHLRGSGCSHSKYDKIADKIRTTKDEFINLAVQVHGFKYDYSKVKFKALSEKVIISCPEHGEFIQEASSHLRGCGCPSCKRSLGEEKISKFLIDKGFDFIPQYRIPNETLFCKNKKFLVDFYLPKNKTIIEFNGIQHYKSLDYFGGEERFEQQQIRDDALKTYCHEHNIKLIIISYMEINNIEKILNKKITTSKRKER